MKLNFTAATDPGLIRSNNQDAYWIDPEGRFFIVADGMGGHAGGEEASRIATTEIKAFLTAHWQGSQSCSELLAQAFWQANEAILKDQQDHRERSDMGTTVVAMVFRSPEPPSYAHIGDSRLYRLRESKIEQITEDDTWVAKAIKIGDISQDEARNHPFRHVLSRCLGRDDFSTVNVQSLDLQAGDRLLLCSDGLTEELTSDEIADHLANTPILEKAASSLIEAAKTAGGHDNITVLLVSVE